MPTIDYTAAKAAFTRQKAALTRAEKAGPDAVLATVTATVREWNDSAGPFAGAWPDDWSRWQRALDDSRPWNAPYIDIFTDIR